MKFFPIALLLLLVFDGLKGLTLPQERPNKGLNTTLQANIRGLYEKRNPCSNEQTEASSYEASHEIHHHAKGSSWTEYTHKCSILISNFLKSISNLINCNNKQDGTFTFHFNTSISQKQVDERNCKGERFSLPTIIIEATNCVTSAQSKNPEDAGLTGERSSQEVFNDQFGEKNPEAAFEELTTTAQGNSESCSTIGEDTEADQSVLEITERPVISFETTQRTKPENYPLKNRNADNLEPRPARGKASGNIPNKYVTQQPCSSTINSVESVTSQTDSDDDPILGTTENPNFDPYNRIQDSHFETEPTGTVRTVTNGDLPSLDSRSQSSFTGVSREASDLTLPASSVTQKSTNPLYTATSPLPQNDDSYFFLTTVSPTNAGQTIETIEEIPEYVIEQSESLNPDNVQMTSFKTTTNPNVEPVRPAESGDYLEKQAEYSYSKIPDSVTDLPEFPPAVDGFEREKVTTAFPLEQTQPQTFKKPDVLPSTPLTSEALPGTSSIGLGPQTRFSATKPQPENLFGQGLNRPISEEINQGPSYSQLEAHPSSSESETEFYRGDQYYTTFPPKIENTRFGRPNTVTPPTFSDNEFSDGKSDTPARGFETASENPLTPEISKKAGTVFSAQPSPRILNSYQRTTPLQPAESLIKSNQEAQVGIAREGSLLSTAMPYEKEKVADQVEFSEQDEQNSEGVLNNKQNSPETPIYSGMVTTPPSELQSETVLNDGSVRPPETWKPLPNQYDEKPMGNSPSEPESQAADLIPNFNEQLRSFESPKKRPPVTELKTDAIPVTYGPQEKLLSSLEKETVTVENPPRQAAQMKPNYGSPAPTQQNRFAPESSLTSDSTENDFSDSLSTASSTALPEPTAFGSNSRRIPQEPLNDYYDVPVEQLPGDVNTPNFSLNEPLGNSPTTPYPESVSQTASKVYESETNFQENPRLDAPPTGIYEPRTTSAPPTAELNLPVEEFQPNARRLLPSKTYKPNAPKTAFPNRGIHNGKNFDLLTTPYPTTAPLEFQSETQSDNVNLDLTKLSSNQLPVGLLRPTFSRQNQFSEGLAKTTEEINSSGESEPLSLKPLDYQPPSSFPNFRQPLGTSTNTPERIQFPVSNRPRSGASEHFSKTTFDSSEVFPQQTSTTTPSLNQNNAATFPEQRQQDTVSSQDPRTQIPQPQPSLDYSENSGQLSSNDRESNTLSTDLETSKTFEGSEPNFQPLPSPSASSESQTFTTETYESYEVADEYPSPSQRQPESIGSAALERASTSSSSVGQMPSGQNTETAHTTELSQDYSTTVYDDQVIPFTPPPPLSATQEPSFFKTDLPALETSSTPKTFDEDVLTTPPPRSVNSLRYDEEMITTDSQPTSSPSPVTLLPVELLNNKKEQDFVGRDFEESRKFEDRLERSDIEVTTSQSPLENSNLDSKDERVVEKSAPNQDFKASSGDVTEKKYDPSSQQLPIQSDRLPLLDKSTSNFPKTETYPKNFDLTSSAVGPVHTKTTFEEEITTTSSSNAPSLFTTPAPPTGYSPSLSNEQFKGQGPYLLTTPQPARQFHPENRPTYHTPQEYPPQQKFENRPYENYPQSLALHPQAPIPRPNQFENFPREQHQQFPAGFQNNQFESRFPPPGRFQPGLDGQKDRFMYQDQASSYGNRYLPRESPNFSYLPPSRPGMNSESLSPSPQVPPNFFGFQRPIAYEERDPQFQSYQGERRLGERNFNTPLSGPPYAPQSFQPYSYYPRQDFRERFGPNYESYGPESRDRFYPEQIPYNQMMPPYRNNPGGYFNPPQTQNFLNNSTQQVTDRYEPYTFDPRSDSIRGAKQETEKTDLSQASQEVLTDYKKAVTDLDSGERLVKFDEEVITISPEKGQSSQADVLTQHQEQRQNPASYNFRNPGRQKASTFEEFNNATASGQMPYGPMGIPPEERQRGNFAFHAQNTPPEFSRPRSFYSKSHPPFSQPLDSFGPQQASFSPNFSNRFRSASNFQQQSNANFVNPEKPNGGNEVGSNLPQSDSYALGPDQVSPSRQPGENYVSFHGRSCEKSLLCPCDRALKGNMTAPSYYILVSKVSLDAGGEQVFKVEKVYQGDGTPLNDTFYEGKAFSTSQHAPVPFLAAGTVQLPTKNP